MGSRVVFLAAIWLAILWLKGKEFVPQVQEQLGDYHKGGYSGQEKDGPRYVSISNRFRGEKG